MFPSPCFASVTGPTTMRLPKPWRRSRMSSRPPSLTFAASTTRPPQPGPYSLVACGLLRGSSTPGLSPRLTLHKTCHLILTRSTLRPASRGANSLPTTTSPRTKTSTRSLWPEQDIAPPGSKPSRHRQCPTPCKAPPPRSASYPTLRPALLQGTSIRTRVDMQYQVAAKDQV